MEVNKEKMRDVTYTFKVVTTVTFNVVLQIINEF